MLEVEKRDNGLVDTDIEEFAAGGIDTAIAEAEFAVD